MSIRVYTAFPVLLFVNFLIVHSPKDTWLTCMFWGQFHTSREFDVEPLRTGGLRTWQQLVCPRLTGGGPLQNCRNICDILVMVHCPAWLAGTRLLRQALYYKDFIILRAVCAQELANAGANRGGLAEVVQLAVYSATTDTRTQPLEPQAP